MIKPQLKYFCLVDFGRLTTVTDMRQSLQTMTSRPYSIRPLLSCSLADMHVLGSLATFILNRCKKGDGNRKIVQYLVEVDGEGAKM